MNFQRIAYLLRVLADEFSKEVVAPTPEPIPEPIPEPTGNYQVLISFYEVDHKWIGETVDVWLNGKRYEFRGKSQYDPSWTQYLHQSRGVIVTLNEPLRSVSFDPEQIKRHGAINDGHGLFNYKVGVAPADQDLNNVTDVASHKDYVFEWYGYGYGVQLYRTGSNGRTFDNPNYYQFDLPSDWDVTGKYKILINRWKGQ